MQERHKPYVLLWNNIDRTFEDVIQRSIQDAAAIPPLPKDVIRPNPIRNDEGLPTNIGVYNPLGGRKSSRSVGGYVSLSNYNVLP